MAPEAVAAPHPGRKMSRPLFDVGRFGDCCASDPWRAPSSIRSNLVFRRDNRIDDALILPHHANPAGLNFRERHLFQPATMPQSGPFDYGPKIQTNALP